jgi:hypothetical protein
MNKLSKYNLSIDLPIIAQPSELQNCYAQDATEIETIWKKIH